MTISLNKLRFLHAFSVLFFWFHIYYWRAAQGWGVSGLQLVGIGFKADIRMLKLKFVNIQMYHSESFSLRIEPTRPVISRKLPLNVR